MDYSEFLTYLTGYLHSDDPEVLANVQNFAMLGASRIASEFRGTVLQAVATIAPAGGTMDLPAGGFLGMRSLTIDGAPAQWVPLARMRELQQAGADIAGAAPSYTIDAGSIYVMPAPEAGAVVEASYLAIDPAAPDSLVASLPALLLRAASSEAQLWTGDNDAAAIERRLMRDDIGAAQGWDVHGSMTLGGVK